MLFIANLRLNRRFVVWISIAVLVTASLLPALLTMPAHAAQMGERSIALDDSSNGKTDVNYTVSFRVATASSVAAVVVEFCSDSPIIGDACLAPTGFNIDDLNLVISSATGNILAPTIDTINSDANTLVLGFTATVPTINDLFTFTMGDGDTNRAIDNGNGVINPTNANTSFYARIITYNTVVNAGAYTSTNLGVGNIDDGGIALSTANELTITARVQEVLEFCVGNTDAGVSSDCNDITGTTIDMGVLDSGSITESSDRSPDPETHGYLMMRTNALNGLTLSYLGGLLTSGVNTIAAVGTTEAVITPGTTAFGIDVVNNDLNTETASTVDTSNGGGTTNLTLDAAWDTFNQWTFAGSPTVADTIATSTTVLDDEMLILDFGGTVSNLVPTGLYTTTITFIATGLF